MRFHVVRSLFITGGELQVAKSAYIKLVKGSRQQDLSLEDVRKEFQRYIEMTSHTGEQLGWKYADAAFPYTMEEQSRESTRWLLLKGKEGKLYKYLIAGVGSEKNDDEEGLNYIQLVVPDGATHGDTAKANEFCRYLAKAFQAELHLFNGRIMYFNPRKP
ncbi:DUF1885 family protein [Paludifilum halophilum]|uniref:DUF1885 domain-containing protein n=1 Tax=Paludifilum halophilum TaxID=1642702 RepID=A0A235B886_9BACL|nr:DUF1885 family protein [Paludifilum halophilum]OYD07805.1 hypothetical protein CHM34_10120 [Paludifilum halophilum]